MLKRRDSRLEVPEGITLGELKRFLVDIPDLYDDVDVWFVSGGNTFLVKKVEIDDEGDLSLTD